jgi:2-phospho-L-lactate guanylyltransferase
MAQALVPLKDLVRAKTRLAGLLAPSERRALAQAMVEDVLALLAIHPCVDSINLVSDDPSAHLLAAQYGARHWPESELGCRGLNNIIGSASRRLLALRDEPVLVLHADLPLLGPEDVSAVLAARQRTGGLVVGPDRHGKGTNILCFDAASVPAFCFGQDSCIRHLAAARARGMAANVVNRPGIGLDVDEPQDLAVLLSHLHSMACGRTLELLRESGLGARIEVALGSLRSGEKPFDEHEVG